MPLVDRTNGRLDEIKAFAAAEGISEAFQDRLDYLDNYASARRDEGIETRCILGYDWAPNSLGFTLEMRRDGGDWKMWMVGGLIFHASDQTWGVHT